jgi:hypothetical protein
VAVPRESLDVFRTAELANPLPGPLLPGPADVYLGGDLLVPADVDATPAGATLSLGLGVEQGVKIARRTGYREEVTGITRGGLALIHDIAIDVQNNLARAIQLEVRERIPVVSRDEQEVKLEVGDVAPPWQAFEPDPEPGAEPLKGGHRWDLALQPGETRELRASYAVRIAARHQLLGGNRREA